MKNTKHTPGPWEVVQPHTEANRSDNIEIEDPFGRTATVYGEPADPETQATAALIAAAPDLLAALERAELALIACGAHLPIGSDADTLAPVAMREARRAIARAKGEA